VNEVWRLLHVPDTNSLAVHVSRLRNKLALAGLRGLVETAASGGYMLAPSVETVAIPLQAEASLHAHVRTDGLTAEA
jgi:DNA-binding winged helix-turn-helix (wHTH) protein